MPKKLRFLFLLIGTYWKLAGGFGDFIALLRLRLSSTLLGTFPFKKPFRAHIAVHALGGPVCLRSHTTDLSVLSEIFVKGEYDSLCSLARPPVGTLVDLGANTGLVSRFLLQRFPEARLLAVEPEPGNFAVLKENLRDWEDRAHLVEACVGSTERRVRLETETGEWGYRMVNAHPEAPSSVPVKRLRSLLDQAGFERVDLLKCDIEGAEAELFETCGEWISRVSLLLVECHGGFGSEDLLTLIKNSDTGFDVLEKRVEGLQEIVLLRRRLG